MKKKKKPKAKPKQKVQPPDDVAAVAAGVAVKEREFSEHQAKLETVKDCVKTYEKTTGAKANQTRLIDFVRWCKDNHGLL